LGLATLHDNSWFADMKGAELPGETGVSSKKQGFCRSWARSGIPRVSSQVPLRKASTLYRARKGRFVTSVNYFLKKFSVRSLARQMAPDLDENTMPLLPFARRQTALA